MSDDRYPSIMEKEITITIRWCSPDVVNDFARTEAGLNVQAVALTNNLRGEVLVSWPPKKQEYGMSLADLDRALGYEIRSNVCHFDYDPLGR